MRIIVFTQLKPEKGIWYSRDHLRRKWRAGEFPKPIPISGRRIGWIEAEVDGWIREKVAQRAEPRGRTA